MNNRIEGKEDGASIHLNEGETLLYDVDGNPVGVLEKVYVQKSHQIDGREIRLKFDLCDPRMGDVAPTVGALLLRQDGHWQYQNRVLGEDTTSCNDESETE